MKRAAKLISAIIICVIALLAAPDAYGKGSMMDGGFSNPVLWADLPDPDVIRVGDDFYMVTTTMHLMPGCPVMHSRDLVNWETVGYVFDRLEDTPRYDLREGTVYGKGQWATSLRYRDGIYYVLFSPNDHPYKSYIYKATDPAGPWNLICRTNHFHDSSLLLDDDGRAYVFSGSGNIHLTELESDLSGVKEGGIDKLVIKPDAEETGLHEGSRVVKHDGKYYAFIISWPAGKPRRQLCYRADNIEGPYEKCVAIESDFGGFPYVGQGCMVDDSDGNWWGMIFQDRGGVGRVLTLNPIEWRQGWPMVGDSEGKVPAEVKKKIVPLKDAGINGSDDFEDGAMSIHWQWNHNPVAEGWSLTSHPGQLRLTTTHLTDNIFEARNTLTQRMEGPYAEGAVKMIADNMREGDIAGLAAFNGDTGFVGVECRDGKRWIVSRVTAMGLFENDRKVRDVTDRETARIPLDNDVVYLKVATDFTPGHDMARFSYSTDGENWHSVGEPFKMIFDYRRFFMGTRYALFNYATKEAGGSVGFDWFKVNTTAKRLPGMDFD